MHRIDLLAQPGEVGNVLTTLDVQNGGRLNWLPQETILFEGCALHRRLLVDLDEAIRTELCAASVRIGRELGYNNAGTVEFLYDLDRNEWYFIEMNPRIQVEHTVTEAVLDIDLHGEDVFPLAERLEARGIPFLFHTGHGDREELQRRFEEVEADSSVRASVLTGFGVKAFVSGADVGFLANEPR